MIIDEEGLETREFIKLIEDISKEENINVTNISDKWILMLEKNGVYKYVYGITLDINSKVAHYIAKDKVATSKILQINNIPCVEHEIFTHSKYSSYVNKNGNWEEIINFAKKYNFNIVCKSNEGFGGDNVFKVNSQRELEEAVYEILKTDRNVVLSPYYKADKEFRIIMLDGEPQLIYSKNKSIVIGDGKTSLLQLIINKYGTKNISDVIGKFNYEFDRILAAGERLELSWKFNLNYGAIASMEIEENEKEVLIGLAKKASNALNIRFCSVDIFKVNDAYKILEVNSNVVINKFLKYIPDGEKIKKEVYRNAVTAMFNFPS